MGGPGRREFELTTEFDTKVIDGAVNAVGAGVRDTARGLRRGQTGFVRQYAAVIGLAAVLVLAWFILRGIL